MTTKRRRRTPPAPTVPRVSDTTARVVRGGTQGGVGYALVVLLDSFHGLTAAQFGALVVVVGMIVILVQNVAENRGWIPALMKSVPPKDQPVPLVDDAGAVNPMWVIAISVAAIAVLILTPDLRLHT